jgi:hypothetical protein
MMMGLATALGGSDTEVEARLCRRRTDLREYGISNGRRPSSILRTNALNVSQKQPAEAVGMQPV